MSRIRADRVTNKEGTGAPLFPNGIRVVGLTSLSNVVAGVTTFTSDVSIGGTLTYEDVTNIDSVGLITARTGIKVLAGGINAVGVITATSFSGSGANLTGIDATAIQTGNTSVQTVDTGSDGHVKMTTEGTERVRVNNTTGVNTLDVLGGARADYFVGRSNQSAPTADASIFRAADNTLAFATSNTERLRIGSAGQIGIAGANYGTSGQVITSGGGSAAPSWADAGGGAWEFVSSIENPNTSTVAFTGLTTTNTAAYKVVWSGANINTSNSREMRCRIYLNDGLQTGNNYRHMSMDIQAGSNSVRGYGGTYNAIILSGTGSNSRGYNGELTFPLKQRTSGSTESLQAFYGFCISEYYGNTIRGYHEGSYSVNLNGIAFDSPDNYNVTNGLFCLYRLTRT